jgi:hypothetical protein
MRGFKCDLLAALVAFDNGCVLASVETVVPKDAVKLANWHCSHPPVVIKVPVAGSARHQIRCRAQQAEGG